MRSDYARGLDLLAALRPRSMRSSIRCWSTIRTRRCATTAWHCWRELRALFAGIADLSRLPG